MAEEISKKKRVKKKSQMGDIWKRLKRNKLAMIGMIVVALIVVAAIFAGQLAPYDPAAQDISNKLSMPSGEHLMGTDNYGRDILSRIIYGARISLLVAVMAVIMGLILGAIIGSVAGFYGGVADSVIMRIVDILQGIPGFLLAVCVSAALGTGMFNTALAIAITSIPGSARLVRAQALSNRGLEYVEAAKLSGCSDLRIMFRHMFPNMLSPIIVDSTMKIGMCILMISSLSFIGLGVQPPTPEWGSMLSTGREYIRDFWPMTVFPGLAIMITLFAFNLFGDGLRDALDPRLKR